MSIEDWSQWRFVNPPSVRTVQRWCEMESIPSKKIGKLWFVKVNQELIQTGDDAVDSMINDVLKA